MTHGSLFSGIGGFDLAAEWAGIDNIFDVEIDDFCQKVLTKNFPNTDKYKDIYGFDGTKYKGTIDIISGGFPCQPFSVAGKRKGKADERALFPEMLRVIHEIQPRWVIAENVPGVLSIDNGQYFEYICTSLEAEGYKVETFNIPASSVNAPHLRYRIWIIANGNEILRDGGRNENGEIQEREIREGFENNGSSLRFGFAQCNENASDFDGERQQTNRESLAIRQKLDTTQCINPDFDGERELQPQGIEQKKRGRHGNKIKSITDIKEAKRKQPLYSRSRGTGYTDNAWSEHWLEAATRLCGVDDGLPGILDKYRRKRIAALGNAIVPQVAYQIFKAIIETELWVEPC